MLESTRTQEAEVKKETREQLDAFRKLQEDAEKKAVAGQDGEDAGDVGTADAETSWALGPRKRKKGKERGGVLGGIKLRKAESGEFGGDGGGGAKATSSSPPKEDKDGKDTEASSRTPAESKSPEQAERASSASNKQDAGKTDTHGPQPVEPKSAAQPPPSLGLVAYSSDEED